MHVSQINNEDYSERKKKKPSRTIIPLIWNNFFPRIEKSKISEN
jgi:hypothetical protein